MSDFVFRRDVINDDEFVGHDHQLYVYRDDHIVRADDGSPAPASAVVQDNAAAVAHAAVTLSTVPVNALPAQTTTPRHQQKLAFSKDAPKTEPGEPVRTPGSVSLAFTKGA